MPLACIVQNNHFPQSLDKQVFVVRPVLGVRSFFCFLKVALDNDADAACLVR